MKRLIWIVAILFLNWTHWAFATSAPENNPALLYHLHCSSHSGGPLVDIQIEEPSPPTCNTANSKITNPSAITYDSPICWAKARLIVTTSQGERTEYSHNLHVFDEGDGNFLLQAFSSLDEVIEVASLYYEHEGSYIDGIVLLPHWRDQKEGDVPSFDFNQRLDISSWSCDFVNNDEIIIPATSFPQIPLKEILP